MTVSRETGNYFEWTAANTLRPYELPKDLECRDGESDGAWLKRLGYESEGFSGIEDVLELSWYGRREPGGHAFVATLVERSSWRVIFIPSFDALLRFRGMVSPMLEQCHFI